MIEGKPLCTKFIFVCILCPDARFSFLPSPPYLRLKDIKNAELALYELSRVIALEPNSPEVYEQRAEVRALKASHQALLLTENEGTLGL